MNIWYQFYICVQLGIKCSKTTKQNSKIVADHSLKNVLLFFRENKHLAFCVNHLKWQALFSLNKKNKQTKKKKKNQKKQLILPNGMQFLSVLYHFLHKLSMIFFLFFPENKFHISCKLSLVEIICMKCQNLSSKKKKKKKKCFSMSSAENFTQSANC